VKINIAFLSLVTHGEESYQLPAIAIMFSSAHLAQFNSGQTFDHTAECIDLPRFHFVPRGLSLWKDAVNKAILFLVLIPEASRVKKN
jgi:hypothetical protein